MSCKSILGRDKQQNGTTGWILPLDPTKEVVHWQTLNRCFTLIKLSLFCLILQRD